MTDPTATNVITALAAVQAEIGGISKKKGGEGSISYAYRGIDAIAAAAQPLLGRAGIVISPTDATITNVEQLTVNGKPWTDTLVTVNWTIYGPGGVTDHINAVTQGLGRDNSDKGYNKACTQAFKNVLLRILCIGDPNDDADAPQHQNNHTDWQPDTEPNPSHTEAITMLNAIKQLNPTNLTAFKTWATDRGHRITETTLTNDPELRTDVAHQLTELNTPNTNNPAT